MADPLATVATYWQLEAFAAARSALAAADIETFADDENVISINWLNAFAMRGIKLRVAVEDVERANDVLAGASDVGEPEAWSEPAVASGCPECGRTDSVERSQTRMHVFVLGAAATAAVFAGTHQLLVAFPILTATFLAMLAVSRRRCTECGARW
jgi:hypothetical protein